MMRPRLFGCKCTLYFKSNDYCKIYVRVEIDQGQEISNKVVCATSEASDQPAHTRSLIRAFACRLNIL